MISWIQRNFQQHFRGLFAALLGVIIVMFVFTIGTPGLGDADRRGLTDRPFFGYNLALQRDQERLFGEAGLSATLRFGFFARFDQSQIQNYAFQRAAALHLADQWGIPAATPAEVETQIKTLRMFAGQDGQFDAKAYQNYRDSLKATSRGTTEADVYRIVSDDIRFEKVQKILAGPGYVLAGDVKQQIIQTDTSWTIATASTTYNDFKPEIKPSDADLTQFFEQAGGRYDIPPRVVVSAVEFPAAKYASQVNVSEAEVRAFYDANPSRFPKPTPATPPALTPNVAPASDPNADFAAVRGQVENALKLDRAQKLAATAASDISLALFESKASTPEAVDKFLAAKNLTAKPIPPFTRDNPPGELGGSRDIASEAFRLSKDRLVSDPQATANGTVILVWKETQSSRKPLFTEVKDKVQADYIENERRKRFVELGRIAKTEIEARLKAGDKLEQAATTVGGKHGLKFQTKTHPAFTLRTPPQDLDRGVFGTLERLEKGQLSDMVLSAEAGIFVQAIDKKEPEVTEANPLYTETRKELAAEASRYAAFAYLSEMVENESKKSEPKSE